MAIIWSGQCSAPFKTKKLTIPSSSCHLILLARYSECSISNALRNNDHIVRLVQTEGIHENRSIQLKFHHYQWIDEKKGILQLPLFFRPSSSSFLHIPWWRFFCSLKYNNTAIIMHKSMVGWVILKKFHWLL